MLHIVHMKAPCSFRRRISIVQIFSEVVGENRKRIKLLFIRPDEEDGQRPSQCEKAGDARTRALREAERVVGPCWEKMPHAAERASVLDIF
jgi:hypothetical protein